MDNNSDKQNVEVFSYKEIEGWFDFEKQYDSFVDKVKDGATFVEVGSFLGKSSCYLAQKIKDSGKKIKFYCVDTFEGVKNDPNYYDYYLKYGTDFYWKFEENIIKCGVQDIITPIKNTSEKASHLFEDKSLDLVFIDANHTYNFVKNDILYWQNKVKDNGVMAGHDYANYCDVPRAVDEIFGARVIKPQTGTTWIVNF